MSDSRATDQDVERIDEPGVCRAELGPCPQEIDPECWRTFLDEYSQGHSQVPVSVEIQGQDQGGAHWFTRYAPLLGITMGEPGKPTMEVLLGDENLGVITHVIPNPTKLWLQQDAHGGEMLQIVEQDGTTTRVTLLQAACES
jgi:hypothetical protein